MNSFDGEAVQAKWLDKLPPLRLRSCFLILSAAMLLFFVPVALVARALNGPDAFAAAAVAAAVCWLGGMLTLLGTSRWGRQGVNAPLYALLFGMVFNCAVPFTVGMVLHRTGGALAQAGVFGLIVIFFQFALLIGTLLTLCLVKSPR